MPYTWRNQTGKIIISKVKLHKVGEISETGRNWSTKLIVVDIQNLKIKKMLNIVKDGAT